MRSLSDSPLRGRTFRTVEASYRKAEAHDRRSGLWTAFPFPGLACLPEAVLALRGRAGAQLPSRAGVATRKLRPSDYLGEASVDRSSVCPRLAFALPSHMIPHRATVSRATEYLPLPGVPLHMILHRTTVSRATKYLPLPGVPYTWYRTATPSAAPRKWVGSALCEKRP